jgi:hypothetical protein
MKHHLNNHFSPIILCMSLIAFATGCELNKPTGIESISELDAKKGTGQVRRVYYGRNDRPPRDEVLASMDQVIKEVQSFFGEQMDSHDSI